jgi:acyl-CoA thioester hydrolase
MGEPLRLHETAVIEEWIDYNGHLYDGYYAVLFAKAVDAFLDAVGLDAATRESMRRTIYTLETHVRFLAEVKLGDSVVISAQVLEADEKRARLFLEMRNRGVLAATSEQLLMSIDQSGDRPRSASWLDGTAAALAELRRSQGDLPVPAAAGQGIRLKR